jgi:hypothetical protein
MCTGPWLSRCTLCVFCMDHYSQGVQYVSFAWAMTLKVHIMCILYGPWLSMCTLCVFVWDMTLKVYIMCILYGPWLSRCTLCVFCMDHDSQGVQYVSFAWAMTLKVHIMCILYGPWLSMCTLCVCTPWESWPIQNTHNIHLECHDPYKIHIMYTFRAMTHTKYM